MPSRFYTERVILGFGTGGILTDSWSVMGLWRWNSGAGVVQRKEPLVYPKGLEGQDIASCRNSHLMESRQGSYGSEIPATLAPKRLHDCTPVTQGWELHLASKATSFVVLTLATLLGISVLLSVQKAPSAPREYTASRSAHKIEGRWINGKSLRF